MDCSCSKITIMAGIVLSIVTTIVIYSLVETSVITNTDTTLNQMNAWQTSNFVPSSWTGGYIWFKILWVLVGSITAFMAPHYKEGRVVARIGIAVIVNVLSFALWYLFIALSAYTDRNLIFVVFVADIVQLASVIYIVARLDLGIPSAEAPIGLVVGSCCDRSADKYESVEEGDNAMEMQSRNTDTRFESLTAPQTTMDGIMGKKNRSPLLDMTAGLHTQRSNPGHVMDYSADKKRTDKKDDDLVIEDDEDDESAYRALVDTSSTSGTDLRKMYSMGASLVHFYVFEIGFGIELGIRVSYLLISIGLMIDVYMPDSPVSIGTAIFFGVLLFLGALFAMAYKGLHSYAIGTLFMYAGLLDQSSLRDVSYLPLSDGYIAEIILLSLAVLAISIWRIVRFFSSD